MHTLSHGILVELHLRVSLAGPKGHHTARELRQLLPERREIKTLKRQWVKDSAGSRFSQSELVH